MTDEAREAIEARLRALYEKNGKRLTPELVVRDARSPSSPLHGCFEWDDSAAAEAWREQQARTLMRSVVYQVQTETRVVETVQYVRDPKCETHEPGYVSVEDLRRRPAQARAALRYECGRVAAYLERVRHLALALGLAEELDTILQELAGIQTELAVDE